jgi:hypothetical protein
MTDTANRRIVLNRFKDFTENGDFLEDIPLRLEERGSEHPFPQAQTQSCLVFITTISKHPQRPTAGAGGGLL